MGQIIYLYNKSFLMNSDYKIVEIKTLMGYYNLDCVLQTHYGMIQPLGHWKVLWWKISGHLLIGMTEEIKLIKV